MSLKRLQAAPCSRIWQQLGVREDHRRRCGERGAGGLLSSQRAHVAARDWLQAVCSMAVTLVGWLPLNGCLTKRAQAAGCQQRSLPVAEAVQAAGGVYIIENPIDRSDEAMSARLKLGHWPSHASLWQLDEIVALQCMTGGLIVHFPQCALGGAAQKWTTLLYSPTLATLAGLGELRCYHRRDEHIVVGRGRDADGAWVTAKLAAYPTGMNRVVADALDGAVPADEPAAEATPAVLGDTEMDRGADTAAVGEAASETVVEIRLAHVSQIGADRQAAAGRASVGC